MSAMVKNVIFDLGGVVLDWNPDRIVASLQPQADLQADLKAALFGHADWRLFDRIHHVQSYLLPLLQHPRKKLRHPLFLLLQSRC